MPSCRATGVAALVLLLGGLGCDDGPGAMAGADAGAGGPGSGGAPATTTPPAVAAVDGNGTYQVTSPIDLTGLALVPESVRKDVLLLKGLRDDPAGTFFTVLGEAGVPLVADLWKVVPDAVEGRVQGWMNEAILGRRVERGGESRTVAAEIDDIVAIAEMTLLRFDLLTDLATPSPRKAGAVALAAHDFRGIRYDFLGGRLPVTVPRLVDRHTPINAETEATVAITSPAARSDGRLALGDHAFGIPYGEYAWAGINAATHARYGAPLRGALGALVDCAGMGRSVAQRCVGPVCVGHEAELRAVCERGVDEVVERIQESVQAYNFNAVRFRSGEAELWDAAPGAARDGRADVIAAGTWDAWIDVGMGATQVPARFTGARR